MNKIDALERRVIVLENIINRDRVRIVRKNPSININEINIWVANNIEITNSKSDKISFGDVKMNLEIATNSKINRMIISKSLSGLLGPSISIRIDGKVCRGWDGVRFRI